MESNPDKEKLIEILFDPNVSEVLAELEDGKKELNFLSNKLDVSKEDLIKRLSFLIEQKFVNKIEKDGKQFVLADAAKLSKALENEKNFKNIVDGLTEMDSYLN